MFPVRSDHGSTSRQTPARLPLTRIAAAIYCERAGQKAILIGKGGSRLKAIGASARQEIERLLGTRVFLQLHVIVEPNWREQHGFLDTLDWRYQLEHLAQRISSPETDPALSASSAKQRSQRSTQRKPGPSEPE